MGHKARIERAAGIDKDETDVRIRRGEFNLEHVIVAQPAVIEEISDKLFNDDCQPGAIGFIDPDTISKSPDREGGIMNRRGPRKAHT